MGASALPIGVAAIRLYMPDAGVRRSRSPNLIFRLCQRFGKFAIESKIRTGPRYIVADFRNAYRNSSRKKGW